MSYAFLSHSDKDEKLIESLAEQLSSEKVFYDKWNLDIGKLLPTQIARGIHDAKWFVLVATKNSMTSKFVKYEINLGIIRAIEDEDFQIVVARLDNCEIPFELKPFVYINEPNNPNVGIKEIVNFILTEGKGVISKGDWSSSIIDRYDEVGAIEGVALENISVVCLWGLYGIGKTTLVEHAANKIFRKKVARFPITRGHDELRLSLELAARAKINLPKPSASEKEILTISRNAIIELIRQGNVIFFDDVNNGLDENGGLKPFLHKILEISTSQLDDLEDKPPIFLASNRLPQIESAFKDKLHFLKVGPLKSNYLVSILDRWIKLSGSDHKKIKRQSLETISEHLFGYPLAARLAAHLITKYSVEEILLDLSHFKEIRIDIATQLIGRSIGQLSQDQLKILITLAISDNGLTQQDLCQIFHADITEFRQKIDELFSYQFLQFEQNRIQVVHLLKEYFWDIAYQTGEWKNIANTVAIFAKAQLTLAQSDSEEFVYYSNMAFRLLILCGKTAEAREMGYYYKGELREAAFRLFHSQEYKLCLQYANMWLVINSDDREIIFLKARCLTRLERYDEAEKELRNLEERGFPIYKIAHARGLIHKQKGEFSKSIHYFRMGREDRPDYPPLLRDYGDVLDKIGDLPKALEILKYAYELQPRDRFVVPKYVAVLEKMHNTDEALSIMQDLTLAYPEEAAFHHRLSMLFDNSGEFDAAYAEASVAVKLDIRLHEAITHLAALKVRKNDLDDAVDLLKTLPKDLTRNQQMIRDTICAELFLKQGDLEKARSIILPYIKSEDSHVIRIICLIDLQDATEMLSKGKSNDALELIDGNIFYLDKMLKKYPNNSHLKGILGQFNKLKKSI